MNKIWMRPAPRKSKGWIAVLRDIGAEVLSDHATMTAAGLAFYSLLAIIPILVAMSTLYGLVANPSAVKGLVESCGVSCRGRLPIWSKAVSTMPATALGWVSDSS